MSANELLVPTTVENMRRLFDRTFTEAPQIDAASLDNLLAIGVGGDPYAVRLSHVTALCADKKLMWLPGSVRELVGLISLRGAILPVYDLRALLGYPQTTVPRWFLIAAEMPVALAFDRFDGYRRVPPNDVAPARDVESHNPYVRDVVRIDEFARPIIHVPSVIEAIAKLVGQHTRAKEQKR